MALSGDVDQPILIDSSYRNRYAFPNPAVFETSIKGPFSQPSDPLGIGYVLYQDSVSGSYSSGSFGGPGRIGLITGIGPEYFVNNFIGKPIEVVNPVTLQSLGQSTVAGFVAPPNATGTITGIFVNTPLPQATTGTELFIRQFASTPQYRFASTGAYATGATTIPLSGAPSLQYVGSYIRNISEEDPPSRIVSVTGTSLTGITATVSPLLGSVATGDTVEVYSVRDNETGMTLPGSMNAKTTMVNHRVTLRWIRIPRRPIYVDELGVSMMKTINIFPYLLVRFANVSLGSHGTIQSNNVEASKNIQFVVPVEELSLYIGEYFTLRALTPITIKFNPSEPISFGVFLPDGTPLQFAPDDVSSEPLEVSNADLQISALFIIKRKITEKR